MLSWTIVKKRLRPKAVKRKNVSYLTHKEAARTQILERLNYYQAFVPSTFNRVAIKDQKRCWGSCSSQGNLNFSYKLLFLPVCLRDYIIVHELCHLKVLNHSMDFWNEVGAILPDYQTRLTQLRIIEKTLGTSVVALKKHQLQHQCEICEHTGTNLK